MWISPNLAEFHKTSKRSFSKTILPFCKILNVLETSDHEFWDFRTLWDNPRRFETTPDCVRQPHLESAGISTQPFSASNGPILSIKTVSKLNLGCAFHSRTFVRHLQHFAIEAEPRYGHWVEFWDVPELIMITLGSDRCLIIMGEGAQNVEVVSRIRLTEVLKFKTHTH